MCVWSTEAREGVAVVDGVVVPGAHSAPQTQSRPTQTDGPRIRSSVVAAFVVAFVVAAFVVAAFVAVVAFVVAFVVAAFVVVAVVAAFVVVAVVAAFVVVSSSHQEQCYMHSEVSTTMRTL